jgi:hypothetical protein
MNLPKYKPETWVVIKTSTGGIFGPISGGIYKEDTGWAYHVKNPLNPTTTFFAQENDIIATLEDGEWKEVS